MVLHDATICSSDSVPPTLAVTIASDITDGLPYYARVSESVCLLVWFWWLLFILFSAVLLFVDPYLWALLMCCALCRLALM